MEHFITFNNGFAREFRRQQRRMMAIRVLTFFVAVAGGLLLAAVALALCFLFC